MKTLKSKQIPPSWKTAKKRQKPILNAKNTSKDHHHTADYFCDSTQDFSKQDNQTKTNPLELQTQGTIHVSASSPECGPADSGKGRATRFTLRGQPRGKTDSEIGDPRLLMPQGKEFLVLGHLSSKAKEVCREAFVTNLRIFFFFIQTQEWNINLTQFVIIYSSETR